MSQVLLQDQSCISVLLEDLIIEILSRLPVKTLMRFRAVCKTWKKIISSSYFKLQHFAQEGNRADLLVCWIGIIFEPSLSSLRGIDVFYLNSISLFPYETLESPVELDKGLFKDAFHGVWGPCHGIFCVCFDDMIALWNPATRNLWPIPKSPLPKMMTVALFSFWIDPLTNEFKVFGILEEQSSYLVPESVKPSFVMYTSCNNSWKELEEAPLYLDDHVPQGQCFRYSVSNGLYYFYKWKTVRTIIAYDHFKNMFQEIQMPKIGVSYNYNGIVLDLFGDSLALFAVENVDDVTRTEIWAMKDCWTKVFNGDIHGIHQALGFWNQTEIFIFSCTLTHDGSYNSKLMIYDLVLGKSRKILVVDRVDEECPWNDADFFPLSYKESLISIEINES